jgi:hypothetical protein
MSGALMGEVLAARGDALAGLTQAETLALLAIANRCKPRNRLASIGLAEIRDAIGFSDRSPDGCSEKTARRALKTLKDWGLIEVVQRGHKPRGKPAVAPAYRVADELKLGTPLVSEASPESLGHTDRKLGTHGPKAWDMANSLTCDDPTLHVSTSHVSASHVKNPLSSSLRSDDIPQGGTMPEEILDAEPLSLEEEAELRAARHAKEALKRKETEPEALGGDMFAEMFNRFDRAKKQRDQRDQR